MNLRVFLFIQDGGFRMVTPNGVKLVAYYGYYKEHKKHVL